MKKYIFVIAAILIPLSANAVKWTGWRDIGLVYTYGDADTLYVHLEGESCPNEKKYYSIVPSQVDNGKQLISMVLTAKASKKKVRILADDSSSTVMCYFKGMQIE